MLLWYRMCEGLALGRVCGLEVVMVWVVRVRGFVKVRVCGLEVVSVG
jgi:hypothetical protein